MQFYQVVLSLCCLFASWNIIHTQSTAGVANTATTSTPTTPTRMNRCHNGGVCKTYNESGYCLECTCPVGYSGTFCKHVLTKLIGEALFTRKVNASQRPINSTAIQQLIFDVVSPSKTNTTVMVSVSGTVNVIAKITICFERPTSWHNYTSAIPLQQQIEAKLREPTSLTLIFGNVAFATYTNLNLDVQECVSMWHNCNNNAQCINIPNGFRCLCDRGYSGDGVTCAAIECLLSRTPELPTFATRKVITHNGTELTNPPEIISFGTTVEYICSKHYILADAVTSSTDPDVIECGGSPKFPGTNWSGTRVTCNIDTSLKIAIIISVVSSLIIIMVLGGFLVDYCVRRERLAKESRRLKEEDIGIENDNFHHS